MTVAATIEDSPPQQTEPLRKVSFPIASLGRLGYFARGIVYGLVGLVAAEAALGWGGETTDSQGALWRLGSGPLGPVILTIVGIGLAAYGAWSLAQAVLDIEHEGLGWRGLIARAGYAATSLLYGSLAFSAFRLLLGERINGGERSADEWTGALLQQPFGPALVVGVGLGFAGFGVYQIYQAFSVGFVDSLRWPEMGSTARNSAVQFGRWGFAARGVVLIVLGGFLVRAGGTIQAAETRGTAGALASLSDGPGGPLLLAVVALGLLAFAVYSFLECAYHRTDLPEREAR